MQGRLLSIHMIVKNEENHLPRCLDSLKNADVEWFITDTGSSDRTPEIARASGATVLHASWENDFAQARNISLPLASTEWILCLDADEYVTQGLGELLDYLPNVHKSVTRMRVTIENHFGEGAEEKIVSEPVRLFRANHGYQYVGRIHEQLVRQHDERGRDHAPDVPQKETHSSQTSEKHELVDEEPLSPLCLGHDGYLASSIAQGDKPKRNLMLIEQELADDSAHPFHLYNLGVTYCQLGQLQQAADTFRESLLQADLHAPYRATLIRDLAKVLMALERYEESHVLLATERHRYPDYPDLHLLYGERLEQQGLEERAYQSYARASTCRDDLEVQDHAKAGAPSSSYVMEAGSGSFRAYTAMARLAQKRAFWQEATSLYGLALDHLFTYGPAWIGLADVLHQSGASDEQIAETLLARVKARTKQDNGEAGQGEWVSSIDTTCENDTDFMHIAHVLAGCGAYEQALNMLDTEVACVHIPAGDRVHWMLCAYKVSAALQLAEDSWGVTGEDGVLHNGYDSSNKHGYENDAGPRVEERSDWALACWANGGRLSATFLATAPPQEIKMWKTMDCFLHEDEDQFNKSDFRSEERRLLAWSQEDQMVAKQVVLRAVQTGQLTLAEQLHKLRTRMTVDHDAKGTDTAVRREFAGLLYRQGYTMVAAELLLRCMSEVELDAEGLFWLGETLLSKGYPDQAVLLFEQALEREAAFKQARAGAASCYLLMAIERIRKEQVRSPEAAELAVQQRALEQQWRTLEGIPWRTVYYARERRNHLASSANLSVHDR